MRILIFTSAFPRFKNNSSGIFIWNFVKNLRSNREMQRFVLAPDSPISKSKETWKGVNIIRYKYFFKKYQNLVYGDAIVKKIKSNPVLLSLIPPFLISQFFHLAKLTFKHHIQIVHAHWVFPQGLFAVFLKKIISRKLSVIVSVHGTDIFGLRGIFFARIKKWVIGNADAITVNSAAVRNEVLKYNTPKMMETIPMGTDVPKINGAISFEKPFILFVGRLTEVKGVEYLIKAMSLIHKEIPELSLIIVGDGSEKAKLKQLTAQLELKHVVRFEGNKNFNELGDYYANAQVFVGPSISTNSGEQEGFGLVFVEALLSKCPIIGTRTGGITDIIKDHDTGLLVDQKSPEDIFQAVIKILNNRELRNKLILNGYKFANENFTWPSISERFMLIYQNSISSDE